MFSKTFFASLALASFVSAANMTISTPASLIECQPVALSWSGGTAPYIIAAIPGGQVSAAALETIASSVSATTYTWTVDIASGTSVTIKLTDSLGVIAYSSADTIQAGSSSSCLNTSVTSGSSASSSTGSTSAAAAATTTAASSGTTSKASTTSTGSTSKASTSTSASAAAASTSASSASPLVAAMQLPAVLLTAFGGVLAFF